ncbi:hypothetical protein HNQ07_004494 [Deinococcus metalli]|uniref:Uncharacterized protein n=1 Tax=Deinococcus metalli TaxID=1141878 RepID=A0A7W8KIT6_9DEIO|nr:hypothetical protein [Deinococcus metalli]MBB5378984.1 hypothetical protein [Deinococcus metalli]GHF63588.1 hypothetical protein GCM10017781_44420 [Deinococcus metalli]
MTKSKPSDVLSRMKAAASREKPASTTSAPDEPSVDMPPTSPAPAVPRARRVRFTLDLNPEVHKDLKRFALEADADASEVMRALLAILHSDPQVRNAVLTAISKG